MLTICLLTLHVLVAAAQERLPALSGKIITDDKQEVPFATIRLKGTQYSCQSNDKGMYFLHAPAGKYTIVVSAIGYGTVEKPVVLTEQRQKMHITLAASQVNLNEAVVMATGVGRVNQSAFNAVAIDTRKLYNTTQNLSDALAKAPGMKLRESGGVGSDMSFMMDGFSGRNVKVFIDGVPQEGVGESFGLNNIPVNFAERIEVYRGVVPVGFGTDALGGVVNIVTKKDRRPFFADASYSFGSFNTHKSNIHLGQRFKCGAFYEINAFQNYSDNSYYINTPVEHFLPDGGAMIDSRLIERVRRFNDTYHNEAVIGKVGVQGKPYADRLLLSLTYSHMYKDEQNGVSQEVVFGQRHSHGHSLIPALEYSKRNFLVKNLSLALTANYNHNITQNVDTATYHYNWLGEKRYMNGQVGEQSYQDSRSRNSNWNATATATYRVGHIHTLTLSEVTNNFKRQRTDAPGSTETSAEEQAIDKLTRKNVLGLSWRLAPSDKWNLSLFGKYYHQHNSGPVSTSATGTTDFVRITSTTDALGYGLAGTYFIVKGLQAKLSYEKAYRLPTNNELFGDESLELSAMSLKPENSHNFNASLSYDLHVGKHGIYAEAGYVVRDTRDYIQRTISTYSGGKQYASYENHGRVRTTGYNLSARYSFGRLLSIGGTFSQMDARDNVKTLSSITSQANPTYRVRIPNLPYKFANMDATVNIDDLFRKGNTLSLTYDNYYVHSFPLHAENLGSASSKKMVPTQFSHNLTLSYSLKQGHYNLAFECRNFTDEKLYDNFSLQKAGRAFYGKLRVSF